MQKTKDFIPYRPSRFPEAEMQQRATGFYELMNRRRSLRHFSDKPVPKSLIEKLLMTASTAPSGAHKQPWTFCAIADPEIKKQIRQAAEKEEFDNYHGRMSTEWLTDLKPFGTNEHKPFLETVPWIIVVFKRVYELQDQKKQNNYYVNESAGLATGMLLAAIHQVGLCSLTHTPSPMNFLARILGRPANERPFLLIPVGYAADDARVPDLKRKPASQVIEWFEAGQSG